MIKMFNKIPFILLLIFFSCTAQKNINLGSKMDVNSLNTSKILIPNEALVDAVSYKYDNCIFTLGMNQDKTVVFVSTIDPNFKVGDFRINDEILRIFKSSEIHYITGWGYYIQIDSDWYAGFDTSLRPTEHSKIQWFFKYKFTKGNTNLFKE